MRETSLKYFTQVLSVILEFNLTQEACLNAAGLREVPQSDRVKADILADILNFASKSLNDPQIGIKCALKYPILQYTRPSEFLKLCENIKHAADLYNRYCPLFHTVGTPSGVITNANGDRMIWVPNFEPKLTEHYRQFIELIMTNYLTSINWLAWKVPHAVEQINFRHEAILPRTDYEKLFDCRVKFSQEEYSVILKGDVKDAPFPTSNAVELANICIDFDIALNALYQAEDLINRIELHIRRAIKENICFKKAATAEALGLSERSMARDLKNKGTAFKEIKNNVLQDIAVTKINQGQPLAQIANSLGYNDQAAFTRAYKKWFGYPPGMQNASRR